jgi:hypothetical protein
MSASVGGLSRAAIILLSGVPFVAFEIVIISPEWPRAPNIVFASKSRSTQRLARMDDGRWLVDVKSTRWSDIETVCSVSEDTTSTIKAIRDSTKAEPAAAVIVTCGWPFRASSGQLVFGAEQYGQSYHLMQFADRAVPTGIIWKGAAGDIVVADLLVYLAVLSVIWTVRARRLYGGRCFACGYPICSAVCPECGNRTAGGRMIRSLICPWQQWH